MSTLFYVVDPMCSWCYAFSPTWQKILDNLPSDIKVVYVQGGLAPTSTAPMPDDMQTMLQGVWKQIHETVGTEFNFDFWSNCTPRRSTYLSCQAAIAARGQGKEYEMISSIQKQYYLNAKNPSNRDTLEESAKMIGINIDKFCEDLESDDVISELREDFKLKNKLKINSFPSLILKYKNNYFPIKIEYNNSEKMLHHINDLNDNIYF
jgi:putative protein-disulfide isomerase